MALTTDIGQTLYSAFAPAKINLALHVTGRRADGYHDIDSLVMFADVGDRVTAEPDDALLFSVSGRFSDQVPQGPENLVIAAAEALRRKTGTIFGAHLSLVKTLPVGAGIGGGSSDAAAALRVLNRVWKTGLDLPDLMEIGAGLGADVPMCLRAEALRAQKTGAVLHPWPDAPSVSIVVAWPARFVSTGAVFAAIDSADNPPLPDRDLGTITTLSELVDLLAATRNDLTEAACSIEPSIAEVLQALQSRPECLISRMTGSGSACFGIFPTMPDAGSAARSIAAARSDWWVRAATIH